MAHCKLCGDSTEIIFNIKFKAVNICEQCATTIFLQQANWYTQQPPFEKAISHGYHAAIALESEDLAIKTFNQK